MNLKNWYLVLFFVINIISIINIVNSAEIYRWVDADGRVTYSDHRPPNIQSIKIPEIDNSEQQVPANANIQSNGDYASLGPYTAFEIVAPAPNAIITQSNGETNGEVAVSLLVDPPLLEDNRLEIDLDGNTTLFPNFMPQFRLNRVILGTHRLQGRIRDQSGALIAQTASLIFHLRKSQSAESSAESSEQNF